MNTLTIAGEFAPLLLDTAIKGTVLLLLASLSGWLCRRSSAALRHSIWCMTMGGLLVLPVASWILPEWQIPILPPETVTAVAPVAEIVRLPMPVPEPVSLRTLPPRMDHIPQFQPAPPAKSSVQTTIEPGVSAPPFVEPMPAPAIVEPAAPPLTTIEWTSLLVSAGWSLGVALFGVLLLVGLWRTVSLRRTSLTVSDGEWPGMLVELRQRLGLARSVELREHAQSVVPLTWGIWRPVVLLPKLARAWDEPMRRAVLLHELAHVKRGDVACQVLGRLTCVMYWFHPLAWFALRQLRQEREQACDDAVVQSGERASDYAEQLLQVARLCCAPRGLSLGVAMAEGSSIERRILSLFDSARSHGPLTRRVALASLILGGAILAGLAPIQPTASQAEPADDQPAVHNTVLNQAYEATVDIFTEKSGTSDGPTESGFQGTATVHGMGSGFITNPEGFIVTANHVVEGASKVRVRLHDGTELPASVIGQDVKKDLAALRIHALRPLTIMPEEHSRLPNASDEVSVIGHSLGKPHHVKSGTVEALGQEVEISPDQRYSHLIQTNVQLDPGDSGGPLLNDEGKAIGINVAIRAGSQKIGFAMPIQDARKAFVMLMSPSISGRAAQEQMELLRPVFGEAKRGIQIGLAIGSLERTFPEGGRIPLWLFYHNVGDLELTFNLSQDFWNMPVTVADENGKKVQVRFVIHWMDIGPLTITLKPGEVWCIATTGLNLGEPMPSITPEAGKYKLIYPQGIWSTDLEERLETEGLLTGQVVNSPTWSEQLETGTIEFEITPGKDGQPEARVLALVDSDQRRNANSPEHSTNTESSQQVSGIVVDSQGQPVAGAIVWCDVDQDKVTRKPITARVETNAQGEFRFTVPKSSLEYGQGDFKQAAWAWKQGHGIGVGVAVASTRMPRNPDVRLILPETSSVSLQVDDEQGQPLAGAEVSPGRLLASQVPGMPQDGPFSMVVLPPKELRGIATRKTDAQGRVTLDLVPRRYLSSVQVNSVSHGEQSFSDYADVLKLNAVTSVEGELSNHQAGIGLSLTTHQTRPQTERRGPREVISANVQVVTDTHGRFTVPIFPVGEYTIASEELKGPLFLSATSAKGNLKAGPANQLTLEVVPGIPVKGRVIVRGENKGVANASVHVQTFTNLETASVVVTLCQTNENGEYSSYTLPGHYVASSLASLGHDFTLIHPRLSSYPPTFQRPPQIAADAKEATLPEIAVDRGKEWSGTLVDEHENPIVGAYVMPLQSGKRLAPPFPTFQGGEFSFMLVNGATPQAWHLIVDQEDPDARTLPLQVLKKDPLVLQTRRDAISKSSSDPDHPQESFNPFQDYTGGFSPEEIEESRIATEGVLEVLKKAGLSDEEIIRFQTVGPNDLTGIVLDATTQEPIAGADIKLMMGPLKTTTDAHGVFRVQGVKLPPELSNAEFPRGIPVCGTVRKDGYAPRAICQLLGKAGFVVLLDNQTYFEGVITDPAGQPVAGATVKSVWETLLGFDGEEEPLPLSSSTTTNADGAYRLPVGSSLPNSAGGNSWRNEGHDLQVIAPGVGSARKTEEYIAPHSQTKLSLQLIPAIRFQAKIVDSLTGAPAPGFVLYTTSAPYIQGRSDHEGNLVIRDLLQGDAHFVIGDGEAIPYDDDGEWEGLEYHYRNDRYGRWWSPDAKPGQGWSGLGLHIPKENHLQENHGALRFKLLPKLPIQTIMVERTATIFGRVTDPDGRPVSGAKVTPICDGRTVGEHETTSQQDGRYVLSVLASKNVNYHLMVQDGESQAWANGVSSNLATNPGQEIENFDLQLTRPGRVTGRVVRNGEPVANYPVKTVDCEHREYVYYGPTTRTRADGTFELNRVRPGKHFLRAGDLRWPIDKDKGPVIEVIAGEVVADQVLEAKQEPDPDEGIVPEPTPADEAPAAPEKEPTPVGQIEDAPKAGADVPLDKVVWWGEPVDGLEPGLWLTETEDPRNLRVPMDSLVNYRVVVRNTTDKEIEFLVRLLPFEGQDVPYLIPSSQLDPKGKIVAPQPAKQYQAQGAANAGLGISPAYIITLAAGESMLVPGEFGLYVGKAPDERYPQIRDFVPGTHWIVQPFLVHPLSDKERTELTRLLGEFHVTKIDRSGKSRQEPVVRVEAPDDSKGKIAYAKYHVEVGTLDASANRNAEKAIWGEIEKGMQCGIRILNPQPSYKIGDTLEAEVLWRNTSDAVITTSRPRQLDLYPIIEDAEGQQPQIDFGARYELLPGGHDFQPSEVRSLGVTKVALVTRGTPGPKDNKEPGHITLESGKYKLSASGGVGNINPRSGKYEFTVEPTAATVDPLPKALENPSQIRGQIIDEDELGVPNAEVLIVGGTDWNRSIDGHVIAQGITDATGKFVISIPDSERTQKPWGQVWRRAPGYAAARGNSVQSLESLLEKPLTYGPLVKTEGLHLVVHDPAGKPQPGVRVEALSVRVNQGVGYALPAPWRDDNSGVSDTEGRVHLPYIDPGSVDRLELSVVGHTAATQFGPNYFLNYRPQETAPHFIFPTVETGVIEGQLVPAPGVTLPRGLTIPLKTLTGKVDVSGVRDVSVDDEGRFRVLDMPVGEISVLKFLDDEKPLRPWISERVYVKAGETTQLEIPIVTGTRVSGRVQKSDTKLGVADYEFEVYYGPAIKFRGSDLWLLKHPVKADADGKYELFLPPGPINLRLTRYVDGYSDATSWLPREKRGSLGPLHEIPAQKEFELPTIDLVKMLPIQGKLIDQNDKPLADDDWSVYGYPEIPGEEGRFVMNSMAGVQTDKEGHFEGSYPETYPPVRWNVSHRVWKTKYEFDDIKFRTEVIQDSPLILRVDTTKPMSDNDEQ